LLIVSCCVLSLCCSKDTLLLDLHPNAKMILGMRNIAFMHGPEHKVRLQSSISISISTCSGRRCT
jgi:hypothetical protein